MTHFLWQKLYQPELIKRTREKREKKEQKKGKKIYFDKFSMVEYISEDTIAGDYGFVWYKNNATD